MLLLIFAILCDGWTVIDGPSLSSMRVKLAMMLYNRFSREYGKRKISQLAQDMWWHDPTP
jgi:hypothetical protein